METTKEMISIIGKLLDVSSRKNVILEDHSYSLNETTYIPGNYLSIPTQFLFLDSFTKVQKPQEIDIDIDILSEENNELPNNNDNILNEKFLLAINNGNIIHRDGEYESDWQSNVIKFTWSHVQIHVFDKTISILTNYLRSKMICKNGTFQNIKEKVYLEKSMQQFRRLLIHYDWDIDLLRWLHFNLISLLPISLLIGYTEILCALKAKIPWVVLEMTESAFLPATSHPPHIQGMNNGIMTKQIKDNFVSIATLIHEAVTGVHLSSERLQTQNPFTSRNLRIHPTNKNKTIVLVVPPLPFDTNPASGGGGPSYFTHASDHRFTRWTDELMRKGQGWVTEVLNVEGLGTGGSKGGRVGPNVSSTSHNPRGGGLEAGGNPKHKPNAANANCSDGIDVSHQNLKDVRHVTNTTSPLDFVRTTFAALRTRILKLKSQNPTSTVIVWGWNIGSLMACYASLQTMVDAIVCLGFPFVDLKEKRLFNSTTSETSGPVESNLVLLQRLTTPVIYVVGANTRVTSVKLIEQLRFRQRAPSVLLVVGHTNDELALQDDRVWIVDSDDRTRQVHLNQDIADRLVFEAICQHIGHVLALRPAPSPTGPGTKMTSASSVSKRRAAPSPTTAKALMLGRRSPHRPSASSPSSTLSRIAGRKVGGVKEASYKNLKGTATAAPFTISSSDVRPGKPLLKKLFTDIAS